MKLLIFIFLSMASSAYPFSYDSAVYKAQKGNWQDAHSALSSIITDNPDRADVMYDAGVAAYNLGNKCHAATCFTRAAECSSDKNIAFCAHFNAGNVYVDEKKLARALEEYDKALAIEPDNEYARHNRDRVVQMLKEQEQQKQQDEQNQDQEKQDKEKDQQQDQDKQENKDQQNKDDQNQQQSGDDSSSAKALADRQQNGGQDQTGNDQQDQGGNEKQNKDGSSEPKLDKKIQNDREQQTGAAEQHAKHGDNKKEQHQNSANNKKRNGKDELDKQSQDAQKESNEQQGDKHGTTPGQQNVSEHNKSNVSAEDGQEQAITDPWLLRILNDQEMHDKAVNKQLMEAKIRQHGGKNGQNCW